MILIKYIPHLSAIVNQIIFYYKQVGLFWIYNKIEQPTIEIEEVTLQLLNATKLVVEQGEAMKYNHAVFEEIHSGCVSEWKNPYLCI